MALVDDFVLFPRDQPYHNMMHPRGDDSFASMQQSFSGGEFPSFDAYHPMQAFGSDTADFYAGSHALLDAPKEQSRPVHQQRGTPSGSASPSIPHSFDNPPSIMSSTSGASAQSTASSAVGSPYSLSTQALPGQEQWAETVQGLGLAPDIVHNDGLGQDFFSRPTLDGDYSYRDGKLPDSFVGESSVFQSSSFPRHSVPTSQTFSPVFSSPSLGLDTSSPYHRATIDSVMREDNGVLGKSNFQASPVSATSVGSSPGAAYRMLPISHYPPNRGSFKPPTTPASATSQFTRQRSSDQPFPVTTNSRKGALPVTPECSVTPEQTLFHSPLSPKRHFQGALQSPFFEQSSGGLVAPLETTCWFS